jgi:multiple sugar transport system substrate-binding protein
MAIPLLIGVLAGCGSPGKSADHAEVQTNEQPVTVKFAIQPSYLSELEVQRYIIEPVKKKYPFITVEIVWLDNKTNTISNLLASGDFPDITVENSLMIQGTKISGIQFDMTDLFKQHKYDLSRFIPETLDTVKTNNQTDYLVGLPYFVHFNAIYYNKDIFDKFAVPYPKDGLTWSDAAELAKKLSREEGGVQYRGLEPDSVYRPASQLSLPLIDPKTYRSIVDTDQWKKVLQMVKDIYTIPGNSKFQPSSEGFNAFLKEQTIAMYAGLNRLAALDEAKNAWSNWDLAQYPGFPERPGIGTQLDMHIMLMSPSSKKKEAAFKVMTTVVSDEVQLDMARRGKGSVLNNKRVQEEFGKDLDVLKGKNVQAVFKMKPAKSFPPTEFAIKAFNDVTNVVKTMLEKNVDVNTAVRDYNEKMDKYIQENRKQ